MKKLTESNAPTTFIPTTRPQLVEGQGGQPDVYVVEGIFGKVDARNENNRRYPQSIWEKNLNESSPFRRRLTTRSVLGELEHPESGNTHLERVAMIITDAWIEDLTEEQIAAKHLDTEEVKPGSYIMGRYETLNTPRGQILKALHEARVNIGISSRGRGDIRNVDGVDVVQDDYELDTWDAVYLPSVTEAKPKPVGETAARTGKVTEAGDLGSQLPAAAGSEEVIDKSSQLVTTGAPDVTPSNADPMAWKPEAEEIVRALEDAVDSEDDLSSLVPTLQRGINLIDQLASVDDEDAIKLKSQALTLIRVLTNKIMRREAGEALPKIADADGKSKKELSASDKDDKQKKESLIEGAGESTDLNLQEATKEDMAALQDGQPVKVDAKHLIASLKEMMAEGEAEHGADVIKFLEKQEDDVLVRIASRGEKGCVVTLLEPAYGESKIFVKFKDIESAEPEKQEEAMKMKDMMEAVVTENDKLKAQLGGTVSVERYEAAKKLISRLAERLKESDGVPAVRYEAAKKLISGLVERVKKGDLGMLHEKKRVEAATKLIHKLVNEGKEASAPKGKMAAGKEQVTPKVEAAPESTGVVSMTEAVTTSAMNNAKKRAVELSATVVEAPAKEITTESKDLRKRIRTSGKKEEATPVTESAPSLMSAVSKRLNK